MEHRQFESLFDAWGEVCKKTSWTSISSRSNSGGVESHGKVFGKRTLSSICCESFSLIVVFETLVKIKLLLVVMLCFKFQSLISQSLYFAKHIFKNDFDKSVRTLMKKLITKDVAQHFTFTGAKKKEAFEDLKMWDLIEGTYYSHYYGCAPCMNPESLL